MAYNSGVRFKTGLLIGLAVGYYDGAKAGRERYQQLDHYLAQVRATDAYQELRDRLVEMIDEGVARARVAVDDVAFGGESPWSADLDRPADFRGDPTLN